uniref:RNase H type-1 domain-containing protein n=1 Tax=Amphimedon queenslandica TaxID=400682 RepID=A0A1X7VKU3_AMPQE
RFYFSDISQLESFQLHGFSDTSEDAYAAVVYVCSQDTDGNIGISLVIAKSRVSPIKRISIPHLELCGAQLLSQLLHYLKGIFNLTLSSIFAWTDSHIVQNWLQGSSRRFKVFVGNRVSLIIDSIPADRWAHVQGTNNPADAPSRGLFPRELVSHDL